MRNLTIVAALLAVISLAACEKTGEGEFEVKTPNVDVNASTDTATVQTPSVDVGKDTVAVPDVDVKTPAERKKAGKDS